MSDISDLVAEIIADAEKRHQKRAVAYWNALHTVVQWWDGLPSNLRQDIEGSGREPWAIGEVRRALAIQLPMYKREVYGK